MDVQCNSCHKVIKIPDDKVPQGSSFAFTCPYCRERVRVEVPEPPAEPVSSEPESVVDESQPVVEPDSVPPGTKVAFVFATDAAWRKGAEEFFTRKGYYCVLPETVEVARRKLLLQHHDVILVQDGEDCEPVWAVIHSWRGLDRRQRNVILLDENVVSLTPEDAFVRGVNVCLSLGDGARLDELLESCLKEHELSLLPWNQARELEAAES